MTQDEIIRMAREAGLPTSIDGMTIVPLIERFANLVAEEAKEKAAKLLEAGVLGHGECAAAIRGMK